MKARRQIGSILLIFFDELSDCLRELVCVGCFFSICFRGGGNLNLRLAHAPSKSGGGFAPSNTHARTNDFTEAPITSGVAEIINRATVQGSIDIDNSWWQCWCGDGGVWRCPVKQVIHIISDDQGVIFPCKPDELFAAFCRHHLARRVREGRHAIYDVSVDFTPGMG